MRSRYYRQSRKSWWWRYTLAALMIGFAALPVLWVISASLNPAKSLAGASLLPKNAGLGNYRDLLEHPSFPYLRWLWNSLKIAVISVTITVAITACAGYALSRFRFAGKQAFMTGILILNVFPAVLTIIALFGLMQQIGTQMPWLGLDTHGGLIAIYVSFGMGINVLLMKAYIDRLPQELDESALIDGATHGQIFRKVVLPLIRPIIVTVSVLQFFVVYGDFVIARVVLKSTDNLTVMVGLQLFQTSRFEQDWGIIAAGAVLATVPVLVIYVFLQKYVISGLTAGSVKG